jgi:tripartite-type tricarboxylate transporter receptor subunit TctC
MCAATTWSAQAMANDFPSRPIRILVGFSAGGSTDSVARYYAMKMSEILKSPVVIENKPGGSQLIAIRSVMSARPDGYTLYLASGSALSQGPGVRKDLPYDPLKDFSYVALLATAPGVIVITPNLPVKKFSDLVNYSKANPDKLNYGSSGIGSASHLQGEYLLKLSGIKATHVPFKADAEIMTSMSEGSIHFGISPIQGAQPPIAQGRVRALAVTGSKRVAMLPDVPSLSEVDVPGLEGIDPYTYYALVGPPGMPSDVVAKLNAVVNTVSKMPSAITYLQERGFEPVVSTPESLKEFVVKDLAKWKSFGEHVKLD